MEGENKESENRAVKEEETIFKSKHNKMNKRKQNLYEKQMKRGKTKEEKVITQNITTTTSNRIQRQGQSYVLQP